MGIVCATVANLNRSYLILSWKLKSLAFNYVGVGQRTSVVTPKVEKLLWMFGHEGLHHVI